MKKRYAWALGVLASTLLTASVAFAQLGIDNVLINQVDVSGSELYLWIDADLTSIKPGCARLRSVVACSLTEPFCQNALKVALAAHLSGKTVDILPVNTCVASGTKFTRIRTN